MSLSPISLSICENTMNTCIWVDRSNESRSQLQTENADVECIK